MSGRSIPGQRKFEQDFCAYKCVVELSEKDSTLGFSNTLANCPSLSCSPASN
jgi:hypothetical protein